MRNIKPILVVIILCAIMVSCQNSNRSRPVQEPTIKGSPPEVPKAKPDYSDMIFVKGGKFLMGKIDDGNDKKPILYETSVSSFYMDVHEVTAGQYDACIRAGVCINPQVDTESEDAFSKNWDEPNRENHPINWVTFENARKYCQWKGGRLPTEKEFEYALRGGLSGKKYPWGDNPLKMKYGNYGDDTYSRIVPDLPKIDHHDGKIQWPHIKGYNDSFPGTAPVCSFPKNPYGFCDLSGNVWEWCSDKVPGDGTMHVMRGGSWHNDLQMIQNTARYILTSDGFPHVGIRCVQSAGNN